MEVDEETREIDLEVCVNKEFALLQPLVECDACEGFNYNCPGYYALKDKIKYEK